MKKISQTNLTEAKDGHAGEARRDRWIKFHSEVGDLGLVVRRARMRDAIGRLFELELDLMSQDPRVPLDTLLGRHVALRLDRPDGKAKLVTGYVSNFRLVCGQPGWSEYRATVVPFLWFLTRQRNSRIFQDASVPEIIRGILQKQYRYDLLQFHLEDGYTSHEYRVQYHESDGDFLSRLLEQEGIYFWIEHVDGSARGDPVPLRDSRHVTHFSDSPGPHTPEPGYETIPFRPVGKEAPSVKFERMTELQLASELVPSRFVHTDFDFKKPNTPLATAHTTRPLSPIGQLEVFEYPGQMVEVKESARLSRVRLEEIAASHLVLSGTTDALGVAVGKTFKVADHVSLDITERAWLTTEVEWEAVNNVPYSGKDQTSSFTCRFRAIPADVQYRSPRTTAKPVIPGPQTAVVTGPTPREGGAREEIHTDHYGRVKIRFHWGRHEWDSHERSDDSSSCWVRVSQLWAGKNFGAMFIPRVGQEVVVEFLEGDPDRPIITGRVYNQANMPPHSLPETKNTSTIMSRSTKEGERSNFNELRFVDTKGEELVYEQAEKDRTVLVKHDNTEQVGNDETIAVGNDRAKAVGGDETVSVVKNRTEVVGINETVAVKANRTVTVDANETKAVKVKQSISVGSVRQVQVGKMENKTVGLMRTQFTGLVETVNAGLVENINAGLATVISAGLVLELKASGNTISMGPWGIKITGKKIVIKGDQVIINP